MYRTLIRWVARVTVIVGVLGLASQQANSQTDIEGAAPEAPAISALIPEPGVEPDGEPIPEEWTATSRTYETELDGVFISQYYAAPANQLESSEWAPIITELEDEGSVLTADVGPTIELPEVANESALARVELVDGLSVGFQVDNDQSVATVQGAQATYEDVNEGVDIALEAIPGGLKETLILEHAAVPTEYRFPLDLEGLTPNLANETVQFRDSGGDVRLVIPPGFMEDSAEGLPVESSGVNYSLDPNTSDLIVTLDAEWLTAPDRIFPVYVDPSLVVESNLSDTFVTESIPGDNSESTILKVGPGSGGNRNRSFVKFNTNDLESMNIHSAELSLYQTESASCTPAPTDIFAVDTTYPWAGDDSWPGPTTDTSVLVGTINSAAGFSGACPAASVAMDITATVEDWATDTNPNLGLALRARSETSASETKRFASGETANPPTLTVIWSDPSISGVPSIPSNVSPEGSTQSTSVTFSAGYTDPNSDNGKVSFLVYDATGSYVATYHSSVVASGTTVSVTGPSLVMNEPLYYRAVSVDTVHWHYSELTDVITLVRPSAWVSSPAQDSVVDSGTSVTASLASGVTANSVDFLIDGTVVANDTTSPYVASGIFTGLDQGSYDLVVRPGGGSYGGVASPTVDVFVSGDPYVPPPAEASEPTQLPEQRACRVGEVCFWRHISYNQNNSQKYFRDFCNNNSCGNGNADRYFADNMFYKANTPEGDISNQDINDEISSVRNRLNCRVMVFKHAGLDDDGPWRPFTPNQRSGSLGTLDNVFSSGQWC